MKTAIKLCLLMLVTSLSNAQSKPDDLLMLLGQSTKKGKYAKTYVESLTNIHKKCTISHKTWRNEITELKFSALKGSGKKCYPFGLRKRMTPYKAEQILENIHGATDIGGYKYLNDEYIIHTTGSYNKRKKLILEVEVTLDRDEIHRRQRATRQYIADNKDRVYYEQNKKNPHLCYVGKYKEVSDCLKGNCKNGKVTIKWKDGSTFTGSFVNETAQYGTYTFQHHNYGQCDIKINGNIDSKGFLIGDSWVKCKDKAIGSIGYLQGLPNWATNIELYGYRYTGYVSNEFRPWVQKGTYRHPNGTTSKGKFDGKKSYGTAVITYPNKSVYTGEVKDIFTRHGQGVFVDSLDYMHLKAEFEDNEVVGEAIVEYPSFYYTLKGKYFMNIGLQGKTKSELLTPWGGFRANGEYINHEPHGKHVLRSMKGDSFIMESHYDHGKLVQGEEMYTDGLLGGYASESMNHFENFNKVAQEYKDFRENKNRVEQHFTMWDDSVKSLEYTEYTHQKLFRSPNRKMVHIVDNRGKQDTYLVDVYIDGKFRHTIECKSVSSEAYNFYSPSMKFAPSKIRLSKITRLKLKIRAKNPIPGSVYPVMMLIEH